MQEDIKRARKLVGKQVYAIMKDGNMVQGKLVSVKGDQMLLKQVTIRDQSGKVVQTKAFFPFVGFGVSPFGFGGFGGFGFGFPGFFI